ncbi:hypothetical protein CDV36_001278 [Fusarium kuroshium]|uniref:Uncharacterized protein n=1 Tax=Fusarium kuroshium TaxID=2010991 RepID=A0A3M2SN67_9HYPO|nr:hypothetical protein CDV36_001278 [Fusarium kuroshium]
MPVSHREAFLSAITRSSRSSIEVIRSIVIISIVWFAVSRSAPPVAHVPALLLRQEFKELNSDTLTQY